MVKYCIQKDILRIPSSSFTIFNINGITFEEENYFGAQILKTSLKMEDVEEVRVCLILSAHTKTKTVSHREKESRKSLFGGNHGSKIYDRQVDLEISLLNCG